MIPKTKIDQPKRTSMDKLKALMARCQCGVHLTVNEHRNYYQTAEQAIDEATNNHGCPPEIPDDVRKVMIDTNTVIVLHFYPDTPIGFYEIWHHDLDAALDLAMECLAECTSVAP